VAVAVLMAVRQVQLVEVALEALLGAVTAQVEPQIEELVVVVKTV